MPERWAQLIAAMKYIILIIFTFCVACSSRTQTNKETSESPTEELSTPIGTTENFETLDWLTTSNHLGFSVNFEDSCLTTELEVVTLNTTDSTVILVDKCKGLTIGILAAKYQYPDGELSIKSYINKDTILTVSIGEYMGDYFENDYYELLIDSVTTERTLNNGRLSQISRDSIRTTKRFEL